MIILWTWNLDVQIKKKTFKAFEKQIGEITDFVSLPKGKRYRISSFENGILHFSRLDSNPQKNWSFKIKDVYRAYQKLSNFNTASFSAYVPIRHSPARGLLYKLKMIEPVWD